LEEKMKQKFEDWSPKQETILTLNQASEIISNYSSDGYTLSLRQLYYQLVAADLIPNSQRSYTRLGYIVGRGRLAGLVDWNIIEDRGRQIVTNAHWRTPKDILEVAARQFKLDKWENQDYRVFVVVEKDALSGVLEPVCRRLDVHFTANKGYASLSHVYEMAQMIAGYSDFHQESIVLYFGDHDPSGLDMDRDIETRLEQLSRSLVTVRRIALTMNQVESYAPPPNPAKMTDSRAAEYVSKYGQVSWELDALNPRVLIDLVENEILSWRDEVDWQEMADQEEQEKQKLLKIAENWTNE
jgi:hypothetical protein